MVLDALLACLQKLDGSTPHVSGMISALISLAMATTVATKHSLLSPIPQEGKDDRESPKQCGWVLLHVP